MSVQSTTYGGAFIQLVARPDSYDAYARQTADSLGREVDSRLDDLSGKGKRSVAVGIQARVESEIDQSQSRLDLLNDAPTKQENYDMLASLPSFAKPYSISIQHNSDGSITETKSRTIESSRVTIPAIDNHGVAITRDVHESDFVQTRRWVDQDGTSHEQILAQRSTRTENERRYDIIAQTVEDVTHELSTSMMANHGTFETESMTSVLVEDITDDGSVAGLRRITNTQTEDRFYNPDGSLKSTDKRISSDLWTAVTATLTESISVDTEAQNTVNSNGSTYTKNSESRETIRVGVDQTGQAVYDEQVDRQSLTGMTAFAGQVIRQGLFTTGPDAVVDGRHDANVERISITATGVEAQRQSRHENHFRGTLTGSQADHISETQASLSQTSLSTGPASVAAGRQIEASVTDHHTWRGANGQTGERQSAGQFSNRSVIVAAQAGNTTFAVGVDLTQVASVSVTRRAPPSTLTQATVPKTASTPLPAATVTIDPVNAAASTLKPMTISLAMRESSATGSKWTARIASQAEAAHTILVTAAVHRDRWLADNSARSGLRRSRHRLGVPPALADLGKQTLAYQLTAGQRLNLLSIKA